jgi:hypothetical protein
MLAPVLFSLTLITNDLGKRLMLLGPLYFLGTIGEIISSSSLRGFNRAKYNPSPLLNFLP